MSVDGLLPKFFSDLHATNRTPYKTNLLLWYSLVYLRAFVPRKPNVTTGQLLVTVWSG
jgi:APA family basic amino acid/polyamine antiporter